MNETQTNIYDRVFYPTSAHTATHPDRLAIMAKLFGMTPAPIEHCRVLELGCNDGWNLIPMAFGLPESEFIGVDLAAQPIARGRAAIGALQLANIRLEQADLLEFPAAFGEFDYIVAHGVYSWVPEPVRDKLLAIVRAHLTPNGVAFISYNANPAGRIRQMLREIMLYHAGGIEDPVERVVQGVALLQFIAGSRTGPDPYLAVVQAEAQRMAQSQPQSIFHDELEDTYWPVYFHEFTTHAAKYGLQYLSEAALGDMQPTGISTEKYQQLRELAGGDAIAHEQYLDFAKFRKFRQTLLCHAETTLSRVPDTERLHGVFVSSPARRTEPDAKAGPGVERFECPSGDTASTNNPLAKAVLGRLIDAWPRVERFEALLDLAPEAGVGGLVLQLHAGGMIELHAYDPRLASDPGPYPEASRLARFQAAEQNVVLTLQHKHAHIDDESALRLLRLLDGTRDRESLLREMTASQPDIPAESVRTQMEQSLARFARLGLLLDKR